MKAARKAALSVIAATAASSPASASAPHTVQIGETPSGIAAANGISTSALATANGLSADANVILGSTIQVPAAGEAPAPAASAGAPEPMGGYIVQPGETLSG